MTIIKNIVVIALLAGTAPLAAAQERWQPVGSADFRIETQRSVIALGRDLGRLRAIRLEVRQSEVEILELRVSYVNGDREDIRVRDVFRPGQVSRPIRLQGNRPVRDITVTYRPKGPARIIIQADARGGGGGGSGGGDGRAWTELGCKTVGFLIDRDTIDVGVSEGRYESLRLRSTGNAINLIQMRVVYGNGRTEDFNVNATIPPDGATRPIDLAGRSRGIDRIELLYGSRPGFAGKTKLCVEAREADDF
jgi:hypothetical protein